MNIIECTDTDLNVLYDCSALTFIGVTLDDDNLNWLINWFKEHNCEMLKEDFYVITGKLMNTKYHLTGKNAYPDYLNIICIKPGDLSNLNAIIIPRFEIEGKWFDDIVDNLKRR